MASILNATTSSGLVTSADNSGSLQLATNNGTTAVTIDTSQNVGIGTASPTRKLQVHESGAGTNAYIQLSNAATGATSTDGFQVIVGTSSETILAQRENAEMQFWTNNTEQARITAAGNFQFNSGYGSVATAFGCRAWVNFNGSGTVAIRASGNVSSITDNGTGNYTVNMTNAMPDTNYSLTQWARKVNAVNDVAIGWFAYNSDTKTTSAVQIRTNFYAAGTQGSDDAPEINVMIFR
jgi:hypothetical protein